MMSASAALADPNLLAEQMLANGFIVVRDFFPLDQVMTARAELDRVLCADVEARQQQGIGTADWAAGPSPGSSLTDVMHSVLFPSIFSPTLAAMIDKILTDPLSAELLRRVVGNDYRLRVDLVRRCSGLRDVGNDGDLPHAWHRDRAGEFTVGIFFDDIEGPDNSATAGAPGTHLLPYNPFWDFMLGRPVYRSREAYLDTRYRYVLNGFVRCNLFNRRVMSYLRQKGTGMYGRRGDWYIFFNDVWHGRQPNTSGKQHMMVRFGGFATDFEFPEDIARPQWPQGFPQTLRRRYAVEQPRNSDASSVLQRMIARQQTPPFDLFKLAKMEKSAASWLSKALQQCLPVLEKPRFQALPR